ncbi:MAG: hypothetical protein E7K74_02715 [Finegoldia magna]|nr:hypothetical protein [Finegoldia magna]
MRYDGKINKKLRTVELNDDECLYKLACGKTKHNYFKKNEILDYINENYIKNDEIIEENLLNDLNTFKTYRDDVDTRVRKESDFGQFATICLAMLSIIINIMINPSSKITLIVFSGLIVLVSYLYYFYCTSSHSESYKLKFITNVIYTLETIKEDMYRNGNSGMESDEIISSVNDRSDDGNIEDITTEDANER